jgi:ABC-type spermidine/putrescine transport system permease subunit II
MKPEKRDFSALGILWLIYGCLRIVEVAVIVAFSGTFALMWGALLDRVPSPLPWMTAFHVGLVLAAAWSIVSAFFSFVAGIALLRNWTPGRVDTLVAALLALPDLPFGIVLGVYTIAALMVRTTALAERPRSQSHIVIPLVPQGSR